MRIVFFGTPQFAVPSLERLLTNPQFKVLAIVTQPDKRRGRGKQAMPSPVKKIALEHHLPIWEPGRLKKDAQTLSQLEQASADVLVVVAYGQLLPPQVLAMPKLGCINVHGSILPKYRGAAPIQWSLYHGDKETGVTTMLLDEGMDTGDMLLKAHISVRLLDNTHQVATTLADLGADLLVETLLKWQRQEIQGIKQDNSQATYAPLIEKSDYSLDWSRPAISLHNQVRGFYPNCVTSFRDKSLKVIATVPLGEAYWSQLPPQYQCLEQHGELACLTGTPGEVVSTVKNFGPIVQTGKGLLLLEEVQLAGKRPQSGWDLVNGTRLSVGEKLG